MKRTFIFFLCTFLFMHVTLPVNAQNQYNYIAEGYTNDGVHYTVYEIETNYTTKAVGDTLEVTRQYIFAGIIQPPATRLHNETNEGITYTGTLKLAYCTYKNNNTYATYRGTLTAIN